MTNKKKQTKGVNVTISPKAHQKMRSEGDKAIPRRNLRQQVNFINNIEIDL